MSRRFVWLCILALAGITSVSAVRAGRNGGRGFPSRLQLHKAGAGEFSRADRSKKSDAQARAEKRRAAGARVRCGHSRRCASALSIPMTFEPNVGQFDARVKYVGRGAGMTLVLTRSGIDVEVAGRPARQGRARTAVVRMRAGWAEPEKAPRAKGDSRGDTGCRARGCGTETGRFAWRGEGRLTTVSNYFIGGNPRAWHRDVPHFARAVGAADSAEALGVVVYGSRGGVEYDLRLPPGADASSLRLRFSGARRVELSGGDVILDAGGRELRMSKPRIYEQRAGGVRKRVRGEYVMEADGSVGFDLGAHDPRATLVVDPSLSVAYATFLGGAGEETPGNVAVDSNGKVYVGGATSSSSTFPESAGAGIGPVVGASAFYVAKIDPTVTGANSLVYLTFLGGSGTQAGGLIAVDGAGDVAITGTTTSTDFPVTGSRQPTIGLTSGDGNDMVVSEINPTGNQLNFSAYFGGSGRESANGTGGIAVDHAGNVYIASDTEPSAADPSSPDLPVTAGAFQPNWDGENSDGFLAVFAPPAQTNGAPSLRYCTYLGTISGGPVGVGGVAVDASGNAYIGGSTSNASNGFPVQNAFQSGYGGGTSDGFVMKIAPTGKGTGDLVYATLLGGSGTDEILGIALDSSLAPDAYVTGETQSSDFPITAGSAYQGKLAANPLVSGSANAFLAVIRQDPVSGATSLAYSTYLGGSRTDAGLSIAVAGPSSVYVAGETDSPDFPWHDNLQPFNGSADAFLAKFDPTSSGAASFFYATPLGGTAPPGGTVNAAASGVAAIGSGQVYVTGQTTAADFPTAVTTAGAANGFQQSCTSCQAALPGGDAFVVAISESSAPGPSVYFNTGTENFGSANLGGQLAGAPVAVLNGGEQTLTISDIEILGPNASDFSAVGQGACIGTAIPPGPSPHCSMDLSFTPSVGGPEEAFLAVWDNAPGSPQLLELEATGDAPHALVQPAVLNFGDQPVSTTSDGQSITVTNSGNEALTITNSVFSPAGAPFQPVEDSCHSASGGSTLAAGASCTIEIVFNPTAAGPAQGQLQITDNSDSQPSAAQVVTFTGTGTPQAPIIQISPASLTFGNTLTGSTSAAQSVTVENQGSAALTVNSISVAGTNSADFTIDATGTTCPTASGTVATGAQCTVAVRFAPQSAGGSKTATLSFADNDPTSPQGVALSGSATSPASLAVSPPSLAFGSQSEGTTSAAQVVTITNSGSSAAGITGVAIAASSDFAQQNACPPVLNAGAQCQVSVTFAPAEASAPGARTSTLKIPGGTPASVALSGTATQAAVSFTASVNFASQLVGTAGVAQPVTIKNSSSGALAGVLAFTGISIGGTNKTDFSIASNSCESPANTSVSPGSSCTVQIAFQPQAAATCGDTPNRSASLQLQDNAPGSPQTIPLSGAAADFCMASSNGQPVTTPIQAGQTATFPLEVASAGGFTGTVGLSCSSPAGIEMGPCAIVTNPATNPASVQVSPATPGQFTVNVPTVAPASAWPRGGPPPAGPDARIAALCAWLACLLFLAIGIPRFGGELAGRGRRKVIQALQLAALVVGLAIGMAACASGGGGNDPPPDPGTPPGTYTITVTASTANGGSTATRTTSLTVTVE
jgi:Cep192 domain 4/Abnormal spindle-like microcephaly-assoc'd, ASPM-SPD-2-Hydin